MTPAEVEKFIEDNIGSNFSFNYSDNKSWVGIIKKENEELVFKGWTSPDKFEKTIRNFTHDGIIFIRKIG